MGCASCYHHPFFLVFSLTLPRLFVVTTLSLHHRRSIGWTIVSSTRPPSSSTSFDCLTSRRFIAFQIALNTTRELDFLVLFFRLPLSFSCALSRPLARSLLLSHSHSPISISHSDSWVFQDGQHTHSHAQNTSVNPTLFSRS